MCFSYIKNQFPQLIAKPAQRRLPTACSAKTQLTHHTHLAHSRSRPLLSPFSATADRNRSRAPRPHTPCYPPTCTHTLARTPPSRTHPRLFPFLRIMVMPLPLPLRQLTVTVPMRCSVSSRPTQTARCHSTACPRRHKHTHRRTRKHTNTNTDLPVRPSHCPRPNQHKHKHRCKPRHRHRQRQMDKTTVC